MKPTDLGLSAFTDWRDGQDQAFDFLTSEAKEWKVCALPTGVGKSLLAVAYAKWINRPAVILTSTKALQTQYMRDFERYGLFQVKGMGNYPCKLQRDLGHDYNCDLGPCLDGDSCGYKSVGCAYYDTLAEAKAHPLVVTNYAFWFTAARTPNPPIGERRVIVCDEAHSAMEELSRFVGVEFSNSEVKLADKVGWSIDDWKSWAQEQLPIIKRAIPHAKSLYALRTLRSMEQKVTRLLAIHQPGWCLDMFEEKSVRLEPVWARKYVDPYLRQGANDISLLSATIRPYHMDWFGVDDYDFFEVESPFPIERRPVYYLPTVRMSRATEQAGFPRLMSRIDNIIDARQDRKGIIHTVSYARARQIIDASSHRARMLLNEPSNTTQVVAQFRNAKAPCVLVSPSVDTGFDFPYEYAEYQVVAKVPFPVPTDPLVASRSLEDPQYHAKIAASRLVQMTGRVMRAEDDRGETIIIDDNVHFLQSRYKPFFPRWWRDAYKRVGTLPPPPPLLRRSGSEDQER